MNREEETCMRSMLYKFWNGPKFYCKEMNRIKSWEQNKADGKKRNNVKTDIFVIV